MLTRLGLRLRIFLFFCLLAVAGMTLAAAAMAFGWSRADTDMPATPFVTAFTLFAFLNTGVVLAIWLLFDEHVAKPINQIATKLRLDAHSGGETNISLETARYLGDLAPAADALSQMATSSVTQTANRIAKETSRLEAEKQQLTALLTEAPVATILLNAGLKIVLYDVQAADLMSTIALPRLRAPISDYFNEADLATAIEGVSDTNTETVIALRDVTGSQTFDARLRALQNDGYMIFFDEVSPRGGALEARPLVFDFDLMTSSEASALNDTPLSKLCFVPFDTETTGLSVEQDDIVQIGAVRVLNGRIVEGEVLNTFVNPGRPIPPASTQIHHVTEADVADAPNISAASEALHHFAREAVLVAHNAPFDVGLLRKYGSATGVRWDHPVIDTVLLSAIVFGTNEEHSLDALCDRLSIAIPSDERHTAIGDAKATAQVLVGLLPLLEGRGIETLGELIKQSKRHSRLLEDLNR